MDGKPYLSIIAPLLNEKESVEELHRCVLDVCGKIGKPYEIIFVDDGSVDGTYDVCRRLKPLKLISFRRNFGQTAAFDAGIKAAQGDILVTMDGDLQNDPADIPLLLEKIDEGYDIVSGWRWQRKDSVAKKFFSRGADRLRKILLQDNIHDSGCSLKAYRRECFDGVDLFGEMHRFIPAILEPKGFKIAEVKVSHHPRRFGYTKYNWKRTLKGFVDMIATWFWRKYANRPLHLFGVSGLVLSVAGFAILSWMAIAKIFFGVGLSDKIWPLIGVFLMFMGVQLFVSGLLADILVKNYYRSRKQMNYSIKKIVDNRDQF